jgi:hypothetical protein
MREERAKSETGRRLMAANFLPTLFGIVAPLAGAAWLVFLH